MSLYTTLSGKIVAEWAADDCGLSDGSSVASWSQTSYGSGVALTQSTPGARPVFHSNWNSTGYPAVKFDGIDDILRATIVSDNLYAIFVLQSDASAGGIEMFYHRPGSGRYQWMYKSGTSLVAQDNRGGPTQQPWLSGRRVLGLGSLATTIGSYSILARSFVATGTTKPNFSGDTVCIGGNDSVSSWRSPAAINHVILTTLLTATELEQACAQLRARWGCSDSDFGGPLVSAVKPSSPFYQTVIA